MPRAPISNCEILCRIVKWPPSFSLGRIQMLNNATCMKHGSNMKPSTEWRNRTEPGLRDHNYHFFIPPQFQTTMIRSMAPLTIIITVMPIYTGPPRSSSHSKIVPEDNLRVGPEQVAPTNDSANGLRSLMSCVLLHEYLGRWYVV